jgi:hypothetical protein
VVFSQTGLLMGLKVVMSGTGNSQFFHVRIGFNLCFRELTVFAKDDVQAQANDSDQDEDE